MNDLVERLRSVDHTDVEDCFLQSPLFSAAATEIENLRREVAALRAAVIEECAKISEETPLASLTNTSAPGDPIHYKHMFEVAASAQRSSITASIRALSTERT